jgi:hypothetical protein
MKKSHVFVLAVLIATGATFGTYALTRTTELGVQARTASKKSTDATIAARSQQLNALERSLRKALAKKPPSLPKLPKLKAPAPAPVPRVYASAPVVSHAPAPVTVTRAAAPAPTVTRVVQASTPTHEGEHHSSTGSSGGGQDD